MTTMKTRRDAESRSIAEQAAEWLLTLEEGRPEDKEAFADWMRQSPLHVSAFLRASAVDSLMGEVDREREIHIETGPFVDEPPEVGSMELDGELVHGSRQPPAPPQFGNDERVATGFAAAATAHHTGPFPARHQGASTATRPWLARNWRWAAAASVTLVAVGVGALALTQTLSGDSWRHYTTAIGEQRILELEDGSTLFLGPGSKLDVRFTDHERQLRLAAGEAMFRVKHDTARPFRVHSDNTVIQAVGTQFNVNRVSGDAVVSVIEGVVQISQDRTLIEKLVSPVTTSVKPQAQPVRLAAGQETRIAGDGDVAAPTRAEVDRLKAWRERRLTFINETLSTIAAEFNRYNTTPKIRIEDALAGERRYAAAFDADDPESLVVVLEKDPKLAIEQRADEIIIRGR